jgi:hypothetical protein
LIERTEKANITHLSKHFFTFTDTSAQIDAGRSNSEDHQLTALVIGVCAAIVTAIVFIVFIVAWCVHYHVIVIFSTLRAVIVRCGIHVLTNM